MKVRHFLAALMLAFGLGQQAYSEEQKQPEAQQEVQQAPVMQKSMEDAGTSQDKPVTSPDAGTASTISTSATSSSSQQAITNTVAAPSKAQSAAVDNVQTVQTMDWIDSFLYEVRITDALVALFAGLLVLLGWIQARRMHEAVRAAKESVGVAEKSARVAEDALISGQRAFMFIREIQTVLHHDAATGKYHWTVHPIWANSGNTPTRGLSINTTYRLMDEPIPKDYDFPHAGEEVTSSIAGPRSMVEATPGTLSSEDLQAIKEGKKYFYIWGWAEYHDIFEGTRKRVTKFCNQLIQVDGDTGAPANEHNPIQMMFGFHSENNYAD